MKTIEEVKVNKNKETQRFFCQLIHYENKYAILLYTSLTGGNIDDIIIPEGSTTVAHYWTTRGYVVWRMYHAEGPLIGTLFHICKDVKIDKNMVCYLDLIIDIWAAPDGTITILDENELQDTKAAGLIMREEENWIEKQKGIILAEYSAIIQEVIHAESRYYKA